MSGININISGNSNDSNLVLDSNGGLIHDNSNYTTPSEQQLYDRLRNVWAYNAGINSAYTFEPNSSGGMNLKWYKTLENVADNDSWPYTVGSPEFVSWIRTQTLAYDAPIELLGEFINSSKGIGLRVNNIVPTPSEGMLLLNMFIVINDISNEAYNYDGYFTNKLTEEGYQSRRANYITHAGQAYVDYLDASKDYLVNEIPVWPYFFMKNRGIPYFTWRMVKAAS